MSLIHWDKSVLSFHLKEIVEDGHGNNPLALVGLGAIAVTSLVVPAITKLGKPVFKAAIKSSLSGSQNGTLTANSSTNLAQIWQQAAIATQNRQERLTSEELSKQLS